MKKIKIIFIILFLIFFFFPKVMSYVGGISGGYTFHKNCFGFSVNFENHGPAYADSIGAQLLCFGIPFH